MDAPGAVLPLGRQRETVYVLLREDQDDHGFVDTGVVGLFRSEADAIAMMHAEIAAARRVGKRVCGDISVEWEEDDWEVCWTVVPKSLR